MTPATHTQMPTVETEFVEMPGTQPRVSRAARLPRMPVTACVARLIIRCRVGFRSRADGYECNQRSVG
jgi:hypothetical protein